MIVQHDRRHLDRGARHHRSAAWRNAAKTAATVVQLAISRTREYDADREAAHLLGDGRPLASALARIERAAAAAPMAIPPAQASHYIVNPLVRGGLAGLFSTHPPVQARIRRLLELRA